MLGGVVEQTHFRPGDKIPALLRLAAIGGRPMSANRERSRFAASACDLSGVKLWSGIPTSY